MKGVSHYMPDTSENLPVFLCGRNFTSQEIVDIRETVRMFARLSLKELAYTICENLEWFMPNGGLKVESCLQLLKKLEAKGIISLPMKKEKIPRKKEQIIPCPQTDAPPTITGNIADYAPIELIPVYDQTKMRLWNEYIHRYHVLGYKRPFGAHQRYFIISETMPEQPLGCLLFAASAWALAVRDQWLGWTTEDRSRRLNLVVNNTRFLVFPWVNIKNLASKALSLATRRIQNDWQTRYGYAPVLLETFVDAEMYRGTCYRAANWVYLGDTTGRGRMDRYTQYLSTTKQIYVYPLEKDFRDCLCGKGRWANE